MKLQFNSFNKIARERIVQDLHLTLAQTFDFHQIKRELYQKSACFHFNKRLDLIFNTFVRETLFKVQLI